MRLATKQDDLPPGVDPGNTLIVHRIVVVTDVSDFDAVDTTSIIEQSINIYSEQPGNGHIITSTVKTDMAGDYAGVTTPVVLFSEDSFTRAGGRIRVTSILHSEPGEGKVRVLSLLGAGGDMNQRTQQKMSPSHPQHT
jgi:hypothetical protein